MEAVTAIRNDYREIFRRKFYVERIQDTSPEAKRSMEAKAFAWYYVTYHPSELEELEQDPMFSFPWCVYETLCTIAVRNSGKKACSGKEVLVGQTPSQLITPKKWRIERISL